MCQLIITTATCGKWQKLNKLIWACSLSFCFFFFSFGRFRGGVGGGGDGAVFIYGVTSLDVHWSLTSDSFWRRVPNWSVYRRVRGCVGVGLYCYTVQCRHVSNYGSTQHMTNEEKERERMGIELNEQMGKWILHNVVVGRCCVSEDSALVSYSFCVRVTVWAGGPRSLSHLRPRG